MPTRRTIPPSQEIQQNIDELMKSGLIASDPAGSLSQLASLGAQLIIQQAVEDEFDRWIGRVRYERKAESVGSRNGWRPRRLQTGEGETQILIPQVRDTDEQFVCSVFPKQGKRILRTQPLEALVVGGFLRGMSMRDVEDLCVKAGIGKVSKSTASRICEKLRDQYKAFCEKDLTGIHFIALFLDAIYLPTRPTGAKEGVLAAWGITDKGERKLVGLQLGMSESHEDWLDLGRNLTRRGLPAPLMTVSDGAPGLITAIQQLWPQSDRQRCCVHKLRNLLAKLPETERVRVRAQYWEALESHNNPQGATTQLRKLVTTLNDQGYSSAAACLANDLEALTQHLKYPARLRKRWRTTNLLERSLGEVKRRTKVIGRFPGETSCLALCWATLDLVISNTNNTVLTEEENQQIQRITNERNRQTRSTKGGE